MKTSIKFKWLFIASLAIGFCQLSAQTFYNTFDRAPSIGEGVVEVSANFAHNTYFFESSGEPVSKSFGVRLGYGLGDNFDIKASWTKFQWEEGEFFSGEDVNFFVFKPKYSFSEQIALGVPIGIISTEYGKERDNEFYIAPEVMYNYRVNQYFEVGSNVRAVFPLEDQDEEVFVGINIGLGISQNLSQWAVRPELGVLFDPTPDGQGTYITPGLAFSYYIGGYRL